ncbi:MAG: LamG domain-containing protein, partial [Candidatus Aenigmarchaeota archaeon]|nr:LamG domain-containing protein [Candidatus Aenigmarchaeota archaeon]
MISLGVVAASTLTIPVRIYQQKQYLCVDSDYYSGELTDINQLNCLQRGNPFNAKYGVGKIYVKSLSNDTGLIFHLPFDDCDLKDISGLKNDPIENNITCVDTLFGKGIKFNGIDSKLIVNYNPSLDSTRTAISVWLKVDAVSSTQTIIAKSDYPSSGYFLRIEPGTSNGVRITFFVGDSTGSPHEVVADNQDIIGKWTHLVAVYDGTEQAIWINGKKVSSLSWNGDIGLNTKSLEIGNEYGSNYFNGTIDEIAIYNRG